MPHLRRIFAAALVSSALVWLVSAAALAAGNPDREPLPTPPDVTVSCPQGFSALAHVSINKEYSKVFVLADGTIKMLVNGDAVTTAAANGKVLTLNSSGPAQVYFRPDGVTVVAEGHLIYIGAGFQGMWVYTGHVVIDSSGNIVSATGHVTDVCAALAS
jgi:hypothetical protein